MLTTPVVARTRGKTSTFSTAGRALTTIGGVPLAAGKGVIHGGGTVIGGVGKGVKTGGGFVVGGVGHVGGFAGRKIGLIKKKDKSGKEILVPADEDGNVIPGGDAIPVDADGEGFDVPAGQVSQPAAHGAVDSLTVGIPTGPTATTLPPGMGNVPSEPGTLAVTVLSAKDLKSKDGHSAKPYVMLKLGGKSHKTGHVKGLEPEWYVVRLCTRAELRMQERELLFQRTTGTEDVRGDHFWYVG